MFPPSSYGEHGNYLVASSTLNCVGARRSRGSSLSRYVDVLVLVISSDRWLLYLFTCEALQLGLVGLNVSICFGYIN